jgi:hypothetical protein
MFPEREEHASLTVNAGHFVILPVDRPPRNLSRQRVDSPKMPAYQGSLSHVEMPAYGVAVAAGRWGRPASNMGLTISQR